MPIISISSDDHPPTIRLTKGSRRDSPRSPDGILRPRGRQIQRPGTPSPATVGEWTPPDDPGSTIAVWRGPGVSVALAGLWGTPGTVTKQPNRLVLHHHVVLLDGRAEP